MDGIPHESWPTNSIETARHYRFMVFIYYLLNSEIVIVKRCTPLGSKCTPHRPFVKWYGEAKRNRLCSDRFRIAVEPVFVKRYNKIRDFMLYNFEDG